jgi:hypothetical protein
VVSTDPFDWGKNMTGKQERDYEAFKRDLKNFLMERTHLDEDEIDDLVLFMGGYILTPYHLRRPGADRILYETAVKMRELNRKDGDTSNFN